MTAPVTLRGAGERDERALARIAELDGARPLRGPVLVAECDGALRAAISLADGSVIADPFQRTAALVELLRARARQLERAAAPRRRPLSRMRLRRRLALPDA